MRRACEDGSLPRACRFRAGRQRGEQRGDRGGSGSRERSAEAMGARGADSPAALLW